MKRIIAYTLFLFFLSFSYSCVKEVDIITEEETEVIPQEGETRILTGIVKDTSGSILPQARVKMILGDLELETEADENGEWKMTIPNSLTEGYIVANKVAYSKAIHRFKETEDLRVADIYLARTPSNTELDLSLGQGNLRTVIGRIVDSNTDPIPDVTLFLISLLPDPPNEPVFNGFINTLADGSFEITYEDDGFSSSSLHTIFSRACSDDIFYTLQGLDPVEDVGDLELSFENFSVFQTKLESDGSSCYQTAKALVFNYKSKTGFIPVVWDQPLGDVSLEYCPSESGIFYIGVESDDNVHFNGQFLTDTEVEAAYQLDICTPTTGNFLELNIDGTETTYSAISFGSPGLVYSHDIAAPLNFSVRNWAIYTPNGSTTPAYHMAEVKELSIESANGVEYTLDDDSQVNYVNIVQDDDDFYSGVIKAKLKGDNNSLADMTMRFRVGK